MARRTQREWFSIQRYASRLHDSRRRGAKQPLQRRLRLEPLEDRRLLAVVTVGTLDDTVDFNDGVTSLREAIFATNLVGGADTIEFDASLTSGGPATLTLTQGELPITDALVINGPGADLLTIDASGNDPTPDSTLDDDLFNDFDGSRVFNIDDGNSGNLLDVSISGLTLTGGDVNGSGGAIRSLENISLTGSTISGNSAFGNGGGIYIYDGNLNVVGSTISDNAVFFNGGGGGIFSNSQLGVGNNVTVTDSIISGNSGGGAGGIFSHGDLTVTGSTISGNSGDSGGGIFSGGGDLTVTDSTISGNLGGRAGGGIASRDGRVTVTSSTISGNSSIGFFENGRGGGIWSYSGDLTVILSTISGNSAHGNGGGIYSRSGDVTIVDSTVSGNSSDHSAARYGSGGGGGIFNRFGRVTVTRSEISGNSSIGSDGGGIGSPDGHLTITNSTIRFNSAGGSGGGIANRYGTLSVAQSTISYNSATDGGGIWGNKVTVTDSTISDNQATDDGGGIFSRFGGVTMIGSTLSSNSVRDGSGAGAYVFGSASFIRHSTITENTANSADGGGVFIAGGTLAIEHTIVARNSARLGSDLTGLIGTHFDVRFSLIGDNRNSGLVEAPVGAPDADGNLVGGPIHGAIDPLLGSLGDNGGPALTHALLAGSPAIDAGDPLAEAGVGTVPEFDQRGAPFDRVLNGDGVGGAQIDIGAFELPTLPPPLLGDYNENGEVDAADYVVWRRTLGSTVSPYGGADGSGNGVIDQADCAVWRAHFGGTLPLPAAGSGAIVVTALAKAETPLAIATSGSQALPSLNAAAAVAVSIASSDPRPEAGANELSASSAREAAPLPSDVVFTIRGHRTPARSMVATTALRCGAVDAAVSDSLMLLGVRYAGATLVDDAAQAAEVSWEDPSARRERMGDPEENWRTVVRRSTGPVQTVA